MPFLLSIAVGAVAMVHGRAWGGSTFGCSARAAAAVAAVTEGEMNGGTNRHGNERASGIRTRLQLSSLFLLTLIPRNEREGGEGWVRVMMGRCIMRGDA